MSELFKLPEGFGETLGAFERGEFHMVNAPSKRGRSHLHTLEVAWGRIERAIRNNEITLTYDFTMDPSNARKMLHKIACTGESCVICNPPKYSDAIEKSVADIKNQVRSRYD